MQILRIPHSTYSGISKVLILLSFRLLWSILLAFHASPGDGGGPAGDEEPRVPHAGAHALQQQEHEPG